MKKILIILLFALGSIESNACLNIYYSIDRDGHLHKAENLRRSFNTNFNLKLIDSKLKKLENKLKQEKDYRLLSDYSVLLMKAGKASLALEILIELSNHYPEEYAIATNLGTAYELNGELDSALIYINRGLELNPNSHGGSEWVHVNVLKAKMKLVKNKNYLKNHTVLNLSKKQKLDTIILNQILIQVRERFPFSPGPNPIMADLLVDLADCYSNTISVEFAKALYNIAKDYFGADSELMDEKINEMINLMGKLKNIKPERRQEDKRETHLKMSDIRAKDLLGNNNNPQHVINWSVINADLDSLLSITGIEKTIYIPIETLNEIEVNYDREIKEESKKEYWNIILMGLGGFAFMFIVVFIYRRVLNNH